MATYKIIRFFASGKKKCVRKGLTLAEAQAHCKDPSTSKPGKWFEGYMLE